MELLFYIYKRVRYTYNTWNLHIFKPEAMKVNKDLVFGVKFSNGLNLSHDKIHENKLWFIFFVYPWRYP